jgi:hypothetical protein
VVVAVPVEQPQRLGDLAARTAVPRTAPRGGLAAVPLVLVVLAAAGLSAYRVASAGGTLAYRAHGVSFDYPAGWRSLPVSDLRLRQGGNPGRLWTAVLGIGQSDGITVTAYAQAPPVTAANLGAITPYFTQYLRRYTAQGGWVIQASPGRTKMGGMPALEYRATGPTADARLVESTLVYAFDGATEYYLDCQHTPGNAIKVAQACGQVMRTFTVSKRVS